MQPKNQCRRWHLKDFVKFCATLPFIIIGHLLMGVIIMIGGLIVTLIVYSKHIKSGKPSGDYNLFDSFIKNMGKI